MRFQDGYQDSVGRDCEYYKDAYYDCGSYDRYVGGVLLCARASVCALHVRVRVRVRVRARAQDQSANSRPFFLIQRLLHQLPCL